MPDASKCDTHLLEDTPARFDAFGTPDRPGAHERVARAVVELIDSTDGGKVIALEGGWGAGKSTVVGIVRDLFATKKGSAKTLVTSFDAWAHEGDPLRRTYLETLIRALQQESWIDIGKWDQKVDEFSNRRRITRTSTASTTTALGRWLALSVFLVPVGAVCMTAALRDGVVVDASRPIAWTFLFGLLAAGPLFVLVANLVRLMLRKPFGFAHVADPDSWAFLEGKVTSETKTETTETPNPTSLEFAERFDDLMIEALENGHERRIVLVLDNLDRVDPKDALEIWSTLQTFLQHHRRRPEGWFKRLWVLVPFDPIGFRKVWDGSEQSGATRRATDLVSDSFFDKSFQVRFSVPPLVLSEWKNHLLQLIAQALPRHSSADQHAIYRVFEQFRLRPKEPPTPRELKLFVNQIGAVHRQWQDAFPIAHVAYFVLTCRERREFIENLRGASTPAVEAERMLGPELRSNLAGLAFNVMADRGREILLAGPIHQALLQGNVGELNEWAASHQDGFWLTLEHVAQTKFFDSDGSALARIAATLDEMQLAAALRHEADSIRRVLSVASDMMGYDSWGSFDNALARGMVALCRLQNDKQFSQNLLGKLRTLLSVSPPLSENEPIKPGALVDDLLAVFQAVEELGHSSCLPVRFELNVDAEGWKAACQTLEASDAQRRYWARIRPIQPLSECLNVLQATISAGQFSEQDLSVVRVTYEQRHKEQWNLITSALCGRLNAERGSAPAESVLLLRALWQLCDEEQTEAANSIRTLVNGGHAMHHFQRAYKGGDVVGQAVWLLMFLIEVPDGAKQGNVGSSEGGHQRLLQVLSGSDENLVRELARLTQDLGTCDWLLSCYHARGRHEQLLASCLRESLRQDPEHRLVTAETALKHWREIGAALTDGADATDFSEFIKRMARETDLCARIQDTESAFAPESAALYNVIVEDPGSHVSGLTEWCANGLKELKSGDWSADFDRNFDCVRLAFSLYRRELPVKLGLKFRDALEQHAEAVIAGQRIPPPDLHDCWRDLPRFLHPDAVRTEFPKRLIRVATKYNGKLEKIFLELYGVMVTDVEALTSTDEIFSRLFSPWVKDRAPIYGLEWARDLFRTVPQFWNQARATNAAQEFALRVRELITESTDEEVHKVIVEIAQILKLAPPEAMAQGSTPTVEESANDMGHQ